MPPQLSALPPQWVDTALGGDLFCTGPWFRHFAATALDAGDQACFVEWRDGAGGAPLALALKPARMETFPHARLLSSLTNYYSCGYGPIGRASVDEASLRGLAAVLPEAALEHDGVRLGPLDRHSAFARACEAELRRVGWRSFWSLAWNNWYATTHGLGYEQYLRQVPSSFPGTSEKRRQSFLRKGQGTITIATSQVDAAEHLAAYEEVYRSSWKVPEPYPSFMPGLVRLAAEHGWLRLGVLRVGGEPAAAQVWFVVDGRALIYKVAYVERYARLSVGSMLTCAMLERVLDHDAVCEVDFLSGDDDYKAKWMFARRGRHNLLAFNPRRWRGLAAAAREALAQQRDQRIAASAAMRSRPASSA